MTSAPLVTAILIVSVVVVAVCSVILKLRDKDVTSGRLAKVLGWLAVADFIIGYPMGWPFSVPPTSDQATFLVAALITGLLAGGLLWVHLSTPTPAVVRYREMRSRR